MPEYRYFLTLVLICLLAACVSTPKLDTVEEGIAVGYITIESVAKSSTLAYQNKWIDSDEKALVVSNLQQAHDTLQYAQGQAALGNPIQAAQGLDLAEMILVGLQELLEGASP